MLIWLALAAAFGLGALLGAPYLPVLGRDTSRLLDLADLSPGDKLLDLGCGDGRLLRAAARRGIYATGYEINPFIFAIAWLTSLRYRKYIRVHMSNFWTVGWPQADVIYVFLIDRYMVKLDQALRHRIETPTEVVSYIFQIPNRQAVRSTNNAWVYDYPIRESS